MNFSDLSVDDAERYLACVKADGPVQLAELAQLMQADGVNLKQFDGSLESLVPLWEWFVFFSRNGYSGLNPDSRARRRALAGQPYDIGGDATEYAAELLAHYVFEVARGLLRGVIWNLERRKNTVDFQRVKMQVTTDEGVQILKSLDSFCWGHLQCLEQRRAGTDEPDYFLNSALGSPFRLGKVTMERILATPRSGVSILEDLGDPGPALPPLVFPSTPGADAPGEAEEDRVGDELMLAHPKANPENLERARPLDAVVVAETLNALGCTTYDGGPVTVAAILEEEFAEFLRGDDAAMFATESSNGKLRAVHVDAINPTPEQWEHIMTALQTLATKLKARVARSEEFYPPDAN